MVPPPFYFKGMASADTIKLLVDKFPDGNLFKLKLKNQRLMIHLNGAPEPFILLEKIFMIVHMLEQ